ncbi:MAG: TraR/DksA C4-type zinc finger protein [Clostridia bacterium]|nr:TraR/DksA C4-type zinc finger protein [Clostridia bacterium]
MDQITLDRFKQRLLAEKEEVQKIQQHMDEEALEVSLQDSISELSMYDNHPGDVASEVFERSKDTALRQSENIHLQKIDDALVKIDQGTYGSCSMCGQEIPLERLEAFPATTVCIDCKKKEESLPDRHIRPIEEDVIAPPFGGLTHDTDERDLGDSEDDIMFDGEDAFQVVGHWNEHAGESGAGSYWGGLDFDEDRGYVEDVDHIVYERGMDGVAYGSVLDNDIADNVLQQEDLPVEEPEELEKLEAEIRGTED